MDDHTIIEAFTSTVDGYDPRTDPNKLRLLVTQYYNAFKKVLYADPSLRINEVFDISNNISWTFFENYLRALHESKDPKVIEDRQAIRLLLIKNHMQLVLNQAEILETMLANDLQTVSDYAQFKASTG